MNIFERATRQKLRFSSIVGLLSVEDLWDLPLLAKADRPSLNEVAVEANAQLKAVGEESFVTVEPNPQRGVAELRMEIIKHIIAEKQAWAAAAEKKVKNAETRRQLLEALASKQAGAIAALTEDEIKAKLAELEAA